MQVLATIEVNNLGPKSARSTDLKPYIELCQTMIDSGKGRRISLAQGESKQTEVNRLTKAAATLNAKVEVFVGAKIFNVFVYIPPTPLDETPTVNL